MKNNHLIGMVLLFCAPALMAAEPAVGDKPEGSVARAQFTSEIENREPVDMVTVLENDQEEILFFTDIRQMSGRTVTHRWEYQGEVMAEIDFDVGGPRWRVHSSKTLLPNQLGKWSVVVVDESGWPMHAEIFEYQEAPPQPIAPVTEEVTTDTTAPALDEMPVEAPAAEMPEPAVVDMPPVTEAQDESMEIDENPVEVPQAPADLEVTE